MHTKIFSATTVGVDAYPVTIEVDLSFGMINFFIVGLPDMAIKESKQRITTALKNSGISLPERKITVNLAPADLKKEGTLFDLPIALGILQAAQIVQIPVSFIEETLIVGELSLDGTISPIQGILPIACDAHSLGKKRLIVPVENTQEAALIEHIEIIGVSNLIELISYLKKEKNIIPTQRTTISHSFSNQTHLDFNQIKGQKAAKRALQIASAGRHNLLFVGPPGSGKTMLAQRIQTIMPPLNFQELLETSKIYSIIGTKNLITQRPFRTPHHTISQAGLIGGGSVPKPGEISLAHNGILFLDELTEFKRDTLEALRQPLENHIVTVSRARYTITYPASFLLIAALNPCPCGFLGDRKKECSCNQQTIMRYLNKLSGPLLDRIDLQVTVQSLDYETATTQSVDPLSSEQLYEPIKKALEKQKQRFGTPSLHNSTMTPDLVEKYCILTEETQTIIKKAFEKLNLSMRGYHKLLKIARTIADLEQSDMIEKSHLYEAITYRSLDTKINKT